MHIVNGTQSDGMCRPTMFVERYMIDLDEHDGVISGLTTS